VPEPAIRGLHPLGAYPLEDLVDRIDWTPFFQAWELNGRYPAILEDPTTGPSARALYADARALLDRIVSEQLLTARGVFAILPATAEGDDIAVWGDQQRRTRLATVHTLRQQAAKADGRPNLALADFIAPADAGIPDWLGLFAVTAGIGLDRLTAGFEADHDDYSSIMAKALADRLAEAFAERLHERVRREFWAYAPAEQLDNPDLLAERYQGIRPAPGYPACPDHTEKATIFSLLDPATHAGIRLSDSFAMLPAASVSGYYFWRPEAAYFGVGRIGRDQAEDYARRKGATLDEVERWLAPNLGYPTPAAGAVVESSR
jgi:5-methyltetrahydrofolate--homocysteine methyltransferase